MKFILLAVLSLTISCSKQNSSPEIKLNPEEIFVDLAPATLQVGSVIPTIDEDPLDFLSIPIGQSSSKTVMVNNSSGSPVIITKDFSQKGPFVISDSCPASLLSRRKCSITIKYTATPSEQSLGISNGAITINGKIIELIAQSGAAEQSSPSSESLSITPNPLNLGQDVSGKLSGSIQVKNNATTAKTLSISLGTHPELTMSHNCGTSLGGRRGCVISVLYTKVNEDALSHSILIDDISVPVIVSKTAPSTEPSNSDKVTVFPSSYNFGIVNEGKVLKHRLAVRNTGIASEPLDVILDSVAPFSVVAGLSSCGEEIAARRTCYIYLEHTMGASAVNSSVSVEGSIASISASIPVSENSCTTQNALANGIISLDGVSSIAGQIPNCYIDNCLSNYTTTLDLKSCVLSQIQCPLEELTEGANAGIKTWNGSAYSACQITECMSPDFTLVGSTCVGNAPESTPCSLANAAQNGVNITNVLSVSGTTQSCQVASCESGYSISGDQKSCIAKSCTELTPIELTSAGFDLTNATISGTYPTCSVACSSSFVELAANQKSCTYKDIQNASMLISAGNTYVNTTSTHLFMIPVQNAQEIAITIGAGNCSNTTYEPFQMIKNINIPSGDGVKTVSVKFRNGDKESSCISDTIILDQTPPTGSVSLESATTSQNSQAPNAIFSTNDNYEVDSILYAIGSTIGGEDISGGFYNPGTIQEFQGSVNNGFIQFGMELTIGQNYYVSIKILDKAFNESIIYSSEPFQFDGSQNASTEDRIIYSSISIYTGQITIKEMIADEYNIPTLISFPNEIISVTSLYESMNLYMISQIYYQETSNMQVALFSEQDPDTYEDVTRLICKDRQSNQVTERTWISGNGPIDGAKRDRSLLKIGNKIFFIKDNTTILGGYGAYQLYYLDGCSNEVQMGGNFYTQATTTSLVDLPIMNNELYLSCFDIQFSNQVCKTNFVTNELESVHAEYPRGTMIYKNDLYLGGYEKLYRINHQTNQKEIVKTFQTGNAAELLYVAPNQNLLYFRAVGGLWKSDGTEAGTVLIKKISFNQNPVPPSIQEVGNTLFFKGRDVTNGEELWKSDGTDAGTVMVRNIRTGSQNSSPGAMTEHNGKLLFVANDGTTGDELWVSNGTSAGTVRLIDFNPGTNEAFSTYYTKIFKFKNLYPDDAFVIGSKGIVKTNGTAAGTSVLVAAFPPLYFASQYLWEWNGQLVIGGPDDIYSTTNQWQNIHVMNPDDQILNPIDWVGDEFIFNMIGIY